jgi:uncharacterized membrane protein YjgN (DUF898 family)
METNTYQLSYYGKGSELFKIWVVNAILCTLTLGLYYPWAKVRTREYLYSQTTFQDQPFVFTGTGREMFRGFVMLIFFLIAVYGLTITLYFKVSKAAGLLAFYVAFLSVVPFALHGAFRYRLAKTKWQGINFRYTGNLKQLSLLYFEGLFFTIITLGIYWPWLAMDLKRYILGNVIIGDTRFSYSGKGSDYFVINLKGYFLMFITFGVFYFWWQKDLFAYFVNNIKLSKEEEAITFRSTARVADFFELIIFNFFIIVFTLGFGFPWATTRTLAFIAKYISINGNLDTENLQQVAVNEYSDATGDDFASMLDIGAAI